MKPVIGYKFVQKNMKSKEGDCKWKLGKWKKFGGEIRLCERGFHASPTPLDSLEYIYGDRWFIVEARGRIEKEGDKFVASEMRLVKELPVKKILPLFSIACARHVLHFYTEKYPNDKRPAEALDAAENYLNSPTRANLTKLTAAQDAARAAAQDAAWDAARAAAGDAARAAARAAAQDAAWDAARDAAWDAARAAAWDAERKWQARKLVELIKEAGKG